MGGSFDVFGKLAFIAGGSKGLGKELAKVLVREGADVVIFARGKEALNCARLEILEERLSTSQTVDTVPVDLGDPVNVDQAFRARGRIPDIAICTAGGSTDELGFLADQSPHNIVKSTTSNYLISAFVSMSIIRLWLDQRNQRPTDEDQPSVKDHDKQSPTVRKRHLILTSSAAVFVAIPGYTLYTPAKAATRALADTLRQEMLRYSTPSVQYQVHCLFPANFDSDLFNEEQKFKPELTKRLEGSAITEGMKEKPVMTAAEAAGICYKRLECGDFAVCLDIQTQLTLGGMRGPSPRRGLGIWDGVCDVFGLVAVTCIRWIFDARCAQDSIQEGRNLQI